MSGIGDINKDGYDDLIIGAWDLVPHYSLEILMAMAVAT